VTTTAPTSDNTAYTADVILLAWHKTELHVLLIERGWPPFQGHWALPGGYVDPGENAEEAARRELTEETHLAAPPQFTLVGHYDTPGRDPRGLVASTAFAAVLDQMPAPRAGDDARAARWTPVHDALEAQLAFDHTQILTDALTALGEQAQ
jgi:8-oxo-dGTP diphosphatase